MTDPSVSAAMGFKPLRRPSAVTMAEPIRTADGVVVTNQSFLCDSCKHALRTEHEGGMVVRHCKIVGLEMRRIVEKCSGFEQ